VREKVFFDDGGHVALDWTGKCLKEDSNKPIVVVMHGMTGGSETKYIRALA
jgi:predicted alpha/beta-fold hydrolase